MKRRLRTRLGVVSALLAVLALIWALRVVTPWVDRTAAVITGVVVTVLLVVLLDRLILLVGPRVWRFVHSVGVSLGSALERDPQVRSLVRNHPRLFAWLGGRFSAEKPGGLYLSVTSAAAIYFFSGFVSIALSLASTSAITRFDPQVSALLRAFRTPGLTRVFWVATVASDPRVVALATVGTVLALAMWGKRSQAMLFVLTMLGGALVQTAAQLLVHRVRPPAAFALITVPTSFSFPSGPSLATMLFLGALLFVLWRSSRSLAVRLAALWVALFAIAFVGMSRVYLGTHWMSDVVASWSLALAWLSVASAYYLIRVRYHGLRETSPPLWTRNVRLAVTVVASAASLVAVVVGAQADPLLATAAAQPATKSWVVTTTSTGAPIPTTADMQQLPIFAEKLDGTHQEPIGIVFVGTQTQLTSAFQAAGWLVADKPSVATLFRASLAAIANRPYPNAPVTPTFLGGDVQDVAFEKSAGAATVRTRHHVRFWKTHETFGGVPVWVATASFDTRLEIGSAIPLPTHHIDPNIDAEQLYIVQDLVRTRAVALTERVRVTQPDAGTNAQGDQWFTQGYASVLTSIR